MNNTAKKYGLGLALSGGGAKGAAHCGALQAFDEFGIVPDIVAGTSAGSIVASLYASGIRPVEMCNFFITKDFKDLLKVGRINMGLFDSAPLVKMLGEIIPYKHIEDMPIPLKVVACDLDNGCVKVFDRGETAPRVMASCSIPVFFYPMVIDGVRYLDGGVFQNLPASTLRPDCEKLIGVTVHSSVDKRYDKTLAGVAIRSFSMMFVSNSLEDAKMCDQWINIYTCGYSQFDLSNVKKLFEAGYNSTVAALEAYGYERRKPQEKLIFKNKTAGRMAKINMKDTMFNVKARLPHKRKAAISE